MAGQEGANRRVGVALKLGFGPGLVVVGVVTSGWIAVIALRLLSELSQTERAKP